MSAAEAASKATSETKVRIANVDLFSAIKDLVAHVREIAFRIEEGSVDLAREKVSDAVNSAIEVIEHWDSVLTEEKANLLAIFIVQMKELNAQLISFRGGESGLEIPHVLSVLSAQRESLTKIQAEAKKMLQSASHDS